MKKFGMADRHRLKEWMRKYKELGEFGLMDKRERLKEYIDKDRYAPEAETRKRRAKKVFGKSGYRR
ncbi:hypothetical protein [Paenibacillus polymyxa]|uniref:hypothetical protein n=1 Tax=Paenibacillus polymyxa TaxID=1406 RepID=UPI001267C98D|nr:hypothetical protein [Paenibacillus polymyxa]